MKLTFLGTSSMVPTKDRNVTSMYLELPGHGLLFDCGEGTQRQMNIAGINRLKVKTVLVTHWHGDHVSGLVGLIQTIGNAEGEYTLKIYGPPKTKYHMEHLLKSCDFYNKVKLDITEITEKDVHTIFENNDFFVQAAAMDHSVPCVAFRVQTKDTLRFDMPKTEKLGLKPGPQFGKLQRNGKIEIKGKTVKLEDVSKVQKGKSVTVIMDTAMNENAIKIAKETDLLITESQYLQKEAAKAKKYKHMSTKDAAYIAHQSDAKKLIITHFSQRYTDLEPFKDEITTLFPKSDVAYDFKKVSI